MAWLDLNRRPKINTAIQHIVNTISSIIFFLYINSNFAIAIAIDFAIAIYLNEATT